MKCLSLSIATMVTALAATSVGAHSPATDLEGSLLPRGAGAPPWPPPLPAQLPPDAPMLRSQMLELRHARGGLGQFVISVEGKPLAVGQSRPMIGYVASGELRWLDVARASDRSFVLRAGPRSIRVTSQFTDPDGARWELDQRFNRGAIPGTLDLTAQVKVDRDRSVAFLPMVMLFPGVGSFGPAKGQGLFAGLEYLDNEPSSSEADVIGPASRRQVPDNLKITFPLMVIQNDGRYIALAWEMQPHFSALFDSPDRLFGSGGHVLGVLFPGSNGRNHEEGSLLPRSSQVLAANRPLALRATLLGGLGRSVVPALQQYVAVRGLPELRDSAMNLQKYVTLAADGWLDSKIREGSLFRHAIAGDHFKPGPAADAGLWMDWLSLRTRQPALAVRLQQTAQSALAPIAPPDLDSVGVGHVHYPVQALVYGHVAENITRAEQSGRALLKRFDPDGSVKYHANPGGPDYGQTHSSNEANGLTARPVMDLLEAAAFSGNRDLLNAALKELRAMNKFRDGVPRGAQTWECPLHTPDILASAHLVRAYTLGYELTGDPDFLEQARYWAWTGVPFVYLVNPAGQPVGLYGTIAVFGATNWRAPVWMGLPVQWCGLVYADALYRLVRHDPKGPWKRLADGITLSGIQQTWPASDAAFQGLLPDSFVLRAQHRNGPAINPATLQACAVRYFDQTPVYDFWCFRQSGVRLHAPGEIRDPKESAGRIRFQIATWLKHPYWVLLNGLTCSPHLKIDGKPIECAAPHQFIVSEGRLILQLEGSPSVELLW